MKDCVTFWYERWAQGSRWWSRIRDVFTIFPCSDLRTQRGLLLWTCGQLVVANGHRGCSQLMCLQGKPAEEWPQTCSTADVLLSWVGFCGYWWLCGTIKAVPVEGDFTWSRGFVLSKSWMNRLELFLHFKDHPSLDYHICVEQGLSCWLHSILTQKASTLVCSICLSCL